MLKDEKLTFNLLVFMSECHRGEFLLEHWGCGRVSDRGRDFVPESNGVHVEEVFVWFKACKWDVEVLLLPSGGLVSLLSIWNAIKSCQER